MTYTIEAIRRRLEELHRRHDVLTGDTDSTSVICAYGNDRMFDTIRVTESGELIVNGRIYGDTLEDYLYRTI